MIKKTGNRRYRVETRWFGKPLVVLQFEYIETGRTYMWSGGGSVEIDDLPDRVYWADATPEDVMVIEGVK